MSCLTPKLNELDTCDVTVLTFDNIPCSVATLTEGVGTLVFNDGQGGISVVDSDEVETADYNETSETLTLTKKSGELVTVVIPQIDTYITGAVYNEATKSIVITRSDGVTYEVNLSACCGGGTHTHTQPTLVFNADGTMTFTDSAGATTVLPNDDVISGIYIPNDGELILTKRSGDEVTVDFSGLAKRHTQTIPAGTTSITVTHNLPTNFPVVQIRDTSGSIVDYTITNETSDDFLLTFNPATVSLSNVVVI